MTKPKYTYDDLGDNMLDHDEEYQYDRVWAGMLRAGIKPEDAGGTPEEKAGYAKYYAEHKGDAG